MKKLKIAMLTTTFFPQVGGAEYQVKWLAEELAKRGHDVYLFTPYEAEEFIDVNERGFPENIALRKRGANSFSDASRMIYRFAKSIKRIKPDVVQAHYAFSAGFLAVITKPIHKAPVVITSHGEDIQVVKEIRYGMRFKLYRRLLINLTLKLCDAHVIVSNSMKAAAIDAGSRDGKIYTIPNMFVLSTIKMREDQIKDVLRKHKIPPNKKRILSVSRLHPKKGLNYLIESMKEVICAYKDCHLIIAGDGEERQRLEKLVNDQGLKDYITFTGRVEEVEKLALISSCDIFCLPSLSEAFGISLFEPMYYGKSIVASNDEGIQEALGAAGLTVPKKDPISLSKSIIKILEDENLRESLSERGRERYKLFMPDKAIDSYLGIYKDLLGG